MFSSEKIIRATMAHQIEPEAADRALDIALGVERSITCPKSGRVLDSRTAVGVWEVNHRQGTRTFVGVLDPGAADETRRRLHMRTPFTYVFDTAADVWEVIR